MTRWIVAALLIIAAAAARAHGPAQWIQDGAFKNGVGELCCGERDCAALGEGDVTITAAGYFIKSLNEIVPFSEALPASIDGQYWRCFWGGKRKCFFAPPGAA